jgi:hypothetical protein
MTVKDGDMPNLHWKEVERSIKPRRRLGKRDAVKLATWLLGMTAIIIAIWATSDNADAVSLGWGVLILVPFYLIPIIHYLKLD